MKKRSYGALLLVLCLLVGLLAGCGSKEKDDDDKKDVVPSVEKGTIAEMVEAMAEVKQGDLRISYSMKDGVSVQTYDLGIAYNLDKKEYAVSVDIATEYDGQKQKQSLGEVVRIADNDLYFNLGALKSLGLTKTDGSAFEGWFKIPLPKDLKLADHKDGLAAALGKIAGKIFTGDVLTGSEGDYTLTLKGRDAWSTFIKNARAYADGDMKADIQAVADNMGKQDMSFDLAKYVDELINEYESDARSLLDKYGDQIGASSADFDTYVAKIKEAVKDIDLENIMDNYGSQMTTLGGAFNAEETVSAVKEGLEEFEENLGEAPDITVHFTADDTSYCIDYAESYKTLYDSNAEADIQIRLVPGTVKTSAPTERASLKDVAEMLAPSFISYMNKANQSTDAANLSDAIHAADKVAVDPMLDLPMGTRFVISLDGGNVTLTVVRPDGASAADAESMWKDIAMFTGLKSAAAKQAAGKIIGTLEEESASNFGLVWRQDGSNSALNDLLGDRSFFYNVNWADE